MAPFRKKKNDNSVLVALEMEEKKDRTVSFSLAKINLLLILPATCVFGWYCINIIAPFSLMVRIYLIYFAIKANFS